MQVGIVQWTHVDGTSCLQRSISASLIHVRMVVLVKAMDTGSAASVPRYILARYVRQVWCTLYLSSNSKLGYIPRTRTVDVCGGHCNNI